MKRVEVMEFEDQSWFPSWLRSCMTNNIVVMARFLGVRHALSSLLSTALQKTGARSVVDLGSGAGGVMPEVIGTLQEQPEFSEVRLTLTDKYPNLPAASVFNASENGTVSYCEESIDATTLNSAPAGLKTMVNCFHHMNPTQARSILASAVEKREPILIYEMAGHQTPPFPVWLLFLPIGLVMVFLMAFVKSAFVRPFTPQQAIFTYAIPLIPLFYAWDGQASMPRIYRLEDYDTLLEGLESESYTWERGFGQSKRGGKLGSYVLGMPT